MYISSQFMLCIMKIHCANRGETQCSHNYVNHLQKRLSHYCFAFNQLYSLLKKTPKCPQHSCPLLLCVTLEEQTSLQKQSSFVFEWGGWKKDSNSRGRVGSYGIAVQLINCLQGDRDILSSSCKLSPFQLVQFKQKGQSWTLGGASILMTTDRHSGNSRYIQG